MACPRENTGASSNGFVCANKCDGTSRWTRTAPRASSISFLTKPRVNRRRAFFASGRPHSGIHHHPAILGTLPGAAVRSSRSRRQELSSLATEPSPPLAPFPSFAGKRRSLQHSRGRPLSRPRQAGGREDDLGLDRHALRLRPADGLLSARSMRPAGTPAWFPHPDGDSRRFGRFSSKRRCETVPKPLATRENLLLRTPGSGPPVGPKSEMATFKQLGVCHSICENNYRIF